MADKLYCSYCGSGNLTQYKTTKYYKCDDCGRIVVKPIVMPENVEEPATETVTE